MKPDLYQQHFQDLMRQADEIAARPRALYGLEPTREGADGTPFDWMVQMLCEAFELFAAAVLLVLVLALAFSGGCKP